jgi:hypothetical protein
MQYTKIIIHHSACSSINGKGYDYMIRQDGSIISSQEPYDPNSLHLCLQGDFSYLNGSSNENREQFFILQKLLLRLFRVFNLSSNDVFAHSDTCPGEHFPWNELVISPTDGYH